MTKFEIFLAVWAVLNAASRAIPDDAWEKLPGWAKSVLGVSRALGPGDVAKAFRALKP